MAAGTGLRGRLGENFAHGGLSALMILPILVSLIFSGPLVIMALAARLRAGHDCVL